MSLKQILKKTNSLLFSDNILKLFFSYKGVIGRISYITAALLLWVIIKHCVINGVTVLMAAIFLIYCWPAVIQKRSRSFNSTGTWYILANFLFIYTVILTYDIDVSFYPIIKWCIYSVSAIVVVADLILALKPSKQTTEEQKGSFLTRFPIIFTILAFLGIFGAFEIKDRYMPDTNRPAFHLGTAIGEIYRHTYIYPEFCKYYGYELVNYPDKVRKRFKEEIELAENDQLALLAKAANKVYKDINEFYNDNEWGTQEEHLQIGADFFEPLRMRLIALKIADEKKIDVEKVKLTKQDKERISFKDTCKVFDEDADYFVSSDCRFRYILNYAGKYSNCGTYFNTKNKND